MKHRTFRRILAMTLSVILTLQSIELSGFATTAKVYGEEETTEELETIETMEQQEELDDTSTISEEVETPMPLSQGRSEPEDEAPEPTGTALSFENGIYQGDLSIQKPSYLTEDMVIDGNLYIYDQFQLNQCSLQVTGTVYLYDGLVILDGEMTANSIECRDSAIEFYQGRLEIGQSLYLSYGNTRFEMTHNEDYFKIPGDFYIHDGYSSSINFEKGTLELSGDYREIPNYSGSFNKTNLSFGEEFHILLSGENSQMLEIWSEENSLGNVEMTGEEPRRLYLPKRNPIQQFNEEICDVYEGVFRLTQENYDYDYKAYFRNGKYDYPVVYLEEGSFENTGSAMNIIGDFYQNGSFNLVNSITVEGNYGVQSLEKQAGVLTTGLGEGTLNSTKNAYQSITVYGDFIMASKEDHTGRLTSGYLSLYGSLYQQGAVSNFVPEGNFYINFYGYQDGRNSQVSFQDTEQNWLPKCYVTRYALELLEEIQIKGSCTGTFLGTARISGEDVKNINYATMQAHVIGDVTLQSDLTLANASLLIEGEWNLNGHTLICNNLILPDYSNSSLVMEQEKDTLRVLGDFYTGSLKACSRLIAGRIYFCGDVTQKNNGTPDNLVTEEGVLVVFNGSNGVQKVSFDSSESGLHTVEIQNSTGGFTRFLTDISIVNLTDISKTLLGRTEGAEGWTLTEDEVFQGNLWLVDGILDLNGHTLRITGDFYATAGTIRMNGGHLIVEGNLRLQNYMETEGEPVFSGSTVDIQEGNGQGSITVQGDFYEQVYSRSICSQTIYLNENLYSASGGLSFGSDTTLVLNGSDTQRLEVGGNTLNVQNLKIENTQGIQIEGTVLVQNNLWDSGCSKEGILQLRGLGVLQSNYTGDLYIPYTSLNAQKAKLERDVRIQGNLVADDYGDLNGYRLQADTVEVQRSLTIGAGRLDCDTLYMNAPISMRNEQAEIHVTDWYVDLKQNATDLKAGTVYVSGSFIENSNTYTFHPTEDHRVVLCLQENYEGTPTISFRLSNSRFQILQLDTNLKEYDYTRAARELAVEVIGNFGDMESPAPPEGLTVSNITYWTANISWEPSEDNDAILEYRIYLNGELLTATTSCTYTCRNLTQGQEYTYEIQAVDVSGNLAPMTSITFQTPKDVTPPLMKTGSFTYAKNYTADSVPLSWQAATDDGKVSYYNLYRNGELLAQITETSYVDKTVEEGVNYTYSIEAVDWAGNRSVPVSCSVTPVQPPSQVTNLRATSEQGVITVTWNGDNRNVMVYNVSIYSGNTYCDSSRIVAGEENSYSYDCKFGKGDTTYTCTVYPESEAGQKGPEAIVTVYNKPDLLPPEINITGLEDRIINRDTTIIVEAYDNIQASNIRVEYAAVDSEDWIELKGDLNNFWTFIRKKVLFSVEGLLGDYKIRITATDRNGNSSVELIPVAVNYVNVNTVTVTEATPLSNGNLQLAWEALYPEEISYYSIEEIQGDNIITWEDRVTSTKTQIYVLRPDTDYVFQIVPYDRNEKRLQPSEPIIVHSLLDTVLPEVPKIQPSTKYLHQTVSITVNGWDETGVQRMELYSSVNAEDWELLGENVYETIKRSQTATYKLDTTQYMDGPFYLKALVYDFGDNVSDAYIQEYEIDNTPTEVPTGLKGSIKESTVELSWEPVPNQDISYYQIYRAMDEEEFEDYGSQRNQTVYVDQNIQPDHIYAYRVTAVDQAGNESNPSKVIQVSTYEDIEPPTVPEGLISTGKTGSSIQLAWNASTDNIGLAGYRIYRDGLLIGETDHTDYYDTGLETGKFYTYLVTAVDWKGNESAFSEEKNISTVLTSITDVCPADYESIGKETVELSFRWVRYLSQEPYELIGEYSQNGSEWVTIDRQQNSGTYSNNRTVMTWNLEALVDGECQVRIRVIDPEGNEASIIRTYYIDKEAPAPVRQLQVTEEQNVVYLYWDKSISADLSGYYIYRRTGEEEPWTQLAEVRADVTNYTDTMVTEEYRYQYAIAAFDEFKQCSEQTESEWIQVAQDSIAPEVVNLLPKDQVLSGFVTLTTETKDNRGVTKVRGEYYDATSNQWLLIAEVEATEKQTELRWDTSALHGRYKVRILAYDATGNVTEEPYEQYYDIDNKGISKIQNLQGTVVFNSIILSWDQVTEDDFAYFSIEQRLEDSYQEIGRSEVILGYQINNLAAETEYSFRVVGYDLYGNRGEESDIITLVTGMDTVAPVVNRIGTKDNKIYYQNQIPLIIKMTDNIGLQSLELEYSLDRTQWLPLTELSTDGRTSWSASYDWSIEELPEGSVYVRGIATDTAGNQNDADQYVVEYKIDRTAPEQVIGLRWQEEDGIPVLEWNPVADTDIQTYRIYITDQKGTVVTEEQLALFFEHRQARVNETYKYQVSAIDQAGNEGPLSEIVSGSRGEDVLPPQVLSLSPTGATPIRSTVLLSAMVSDNMAVEKVSFYYQSLDSEEDYLQLLETVVSEKGNGLVTYPWDTTVCTDGAYRLWVQAVDGSGNKSEWKTVDYCVDNTAPVRPILLGNPGNYRCLLDWTNRSLAKETVTYEVYRRSGLEEEFRCVYQGTEETYIDADVLPTLEYGYKVRAVDAAGNYSESYVTYIWPYDIDDIAPEAFITASSVTVEGYELVLDGIQSTDNKKIQSFHWDFGDGTEGSGAKARHIYTEAGTYTVTLTVTDTSGNTDTDTATVKVLKKGTTGTILLTVVDEMGNLLPNTCVYAHTSEEENDLFMTDEYGQCKIVAEPGTYQIALFKNGYTAKEEQIVVHLFEEKTETVYLKKGETVSGELTVRELTFEEMVAAGIDIHAPENQHVFVVETVLIYEEHDRNVVIRYINGEGAAPSCHENTSGGGGKVPGDPDITYVIPQRPTTEYESEEEKQIPTLITIRITQRISWLKEMYEAKLVIYNHAESSALTFEENVAALQLPKGISLAKTASPQHLSQEMETIRGGQSQQAVWYLKGNKPGVYTIRASYQGMFMPFQTPVSVDFESNEFTVNAGKGLVLYINPEIRAEYGEDYYVYFTLKNEGDSEFYNVMTTFGTASARRYYRIGENTNSALPLMSSGDFVSVSCLPVGGSISGYYKTKFSGNRWREDRKAIYLELVESQINILKGENLGVRVEVSPTASHINLPTVLYQDIDLSQIAADPVDTWSGAYLEEWQILSMGDNSEFNVTMQYNSKYTSECGEFGYGWIHNYEARLVDLQDGTMRFYSTPNTYYSFMMDNLEEQEPWSIDEEGYYVLDPSKLKMEQTYTCYLNPELELERLSDGSYRMTDASENIYTFSPEGNLTSMTSMKGRTLLLDRTAEQLTVTDAVSGRSFIYHLNDRGLVESVTDTAGRSTHFYYDNRNFLTIYENAVGERIYYTYDEQGRILTASYENGVAYAVNTYDQEGRVLTQDDGDPDTPLTFFEYAENEENGHTTTTVINRLGGRAVTEFDGNGNICRQTNEVGDTVVHTYDANGNELTIKDANGNMKVNEYDTDNNLVKVTDAYGTVITMKYDENNQLISTNNSNGEYVGVTYDEKNQVTAIRDQNGNVTQYTYNDFGQVLSEQDSAGTVTYEYTGGEVTRTTDRMGNVTLCRYDATGRMIETADEYGVLQSCTYDGLGRVVSKTDASGNTTFYTYDLFGNVRTITDPDGGVTIYTYDGVGRLVRMTGPDGAEMEYTVNGEGWVTSITDSLGRTKTFEYDSVGNIIAETDQEGNRTEHTYDGGGNVLTTLNPQGVLTTAEYYPNGKVAKETDVNGNNILYTYDLNWRISNITSDTGEAISYEYDPRGNLTAVIDALGSRTEYTYDKQGNLLTQKDPMGGITRYTYDPNGNVTTETDALGNQTQYQYDARNRLTEIIRADNSRIQLEYDAGNHVTKVTDPMGNTVSYEYDNRDRCVRIYDGNGDVVEETTYNYMGNPITVADALGNITYTRYDTEGQIIGMTQTAGEGEHSAAYTYDKLGRLTQSIDSMGSPIGITYDNMGNITGITDANGGLTSYEYDKAGNLTREINPLQAENRYTYNARNLLEEATNAAGETTTYEYDDLGRITSMTDDLGTITYTYDKNSNVLTVEENGATIQRTYDKLNRVTSYTDYQGRTIKYSYDEVGNLISLTYPGGEIVRYEYNPDGSLATVIDGEGHRTEYTYDKNGQKTSIRRPDGTAELYTYDKAGRLTGQADVAEDGTVIQNLFYTYDEYGNLSEKAGMAVPDPTALHLDSRNMQYDANNRLIRYNDNIVRYDSKGNMTYGPLNGEMKEFRYDCRNRLIQAGETTYTYDAENRRISSTTNGITIEYVINSQPALDQVLEEYQNHELTAIYQYGNGQLISDRIVQTGTGEAHELKERYYHYDNLGSTQALTDENGTVLSTYSYGVYGELLSGDTTLTGYLYNGAYGVHTDENGLYYMRARYYNTDISRFINQDILRGDPSASQSLNRYAYCQGNPLNQNDPFGLCPQGMTQKDWIHFGLSIAGMIPVLGIAANVVNSAMYFYEGDVLNGALCLAGALIGASGFFSALNVVKESCELVQLVGAIEKAGIMITAAASADMTILSAAKTLVLLHENNYVLSGEILLAAADTVMSAMGTMEAFNAIDISTRRTQRMLEEAHCFPAGTKVLTDEGLKNIEDIQPGDYVYSTNDETGESDYKEVLQFFVRETEVIVHVRYEDAEGNTTDIETTLTHRFWSEGEWKSSGTLKAGETLTLADGSQVIILEVTFEDRHETVYNMEVADYHTYYVGEDSVWVHNNNYGRRTGAAPTPNSGQGFSDKGYNPQPGERTFEGYVKNNVSSDVELKLYTSSPDFNNNGREVGAAFKRYGNGSHGGISPHVHQPYRNPNPQTGNIYGGTHEGRIGPGLIDSPNRKDVVQLYQYLMNGKYR